jgi:hypothetical protein
MNSFRAKALLDGKWKKDGFFIIESTEKVNFN